MDENGISDLAKVDFYLLKADGSWLDLDDVSEFTISDTKAQFEYSLDLSLLQSEPVGEYKLWAVAYDRSNHTSNQVTKTFEITSQSNSGVAGDRGLNLRSQLLPISESQLTEAKPETAIVDLFTIDSNWLV
jgi:hypothetical protein